MSLARGLPLPATPPFGVLTWLTAASTLLTVLAAAAVLGLSSAATTLRSVAAGQTMVQVVVADPEARARDAGQAVQLLRATPGVRSAALVSDAAMAAVLRPYIGDLPLAELPVPAMISVALAPGADRALLARRLAPIPSARLDGDAGQAGALDNLLASLRRAAIIGGAIAGIATCLVAMLATRAAMAGHDATIDILHTLGATDGQLSSTLTRRTAREAAIGACIGLLVGIAAIMLMAQRLSALGSELGDSVLLGWGQWAVLLALPFAIVLLAAGTAQATMLASLRRTP